MAEKIKALNLGCGNDYRESDDDTQWINVDQGDCRVDFHLEIENTPFIFVADYSDTSPESWDSHFDEIVAIQVLEHISKENFPNVIRELYRISKSGATWEIAVPHGLSDNFVTDPTHRMPFSSRTFDYFIDGSQLRENGIIYGWGDIHLRHIAEPQIDGNQSLHFFLEVVKP